MQEIDRAALLAIWASRTQVTQTPLLHIMTEEPFYKYPSEEVLAALDRLTDSGLVQREGETLTCAASEEVIRPLIAPGEAAISGIESVPPIQAWILEFVLNNDGQCSKDDLQGCWKKISKAEGWDLWKLADESRELGRRAILIETLGRRSETYYVVPPPLRERLELAMGPISSREIGRRMESLVSRLRVRGITEPTLDLIRQVPRHQVVSRRFRTIAYADTPISIGKGNTTSGPGMIARLLDLMEVDRLRSQEEKRVLVCGVKAGYLMALLGKAIGAANVIGVDWKENVETAETNLRVLGTRFILLKSDPSCGCEQMAPFDRIVIQGAIPMIPWHLVRQLKEGGFVVAPVQCGVRQRVTLVTRNWEIEEKVKARYTALFGEYGWPKDGVVREWRTLCESARSILELRTQINGLLKPALGGDLFTCGEGFEEVLATLLKEARSRKDFADYIVALYRLCCDTGHRAKDLGGLEGFSADESLYFDGIGKVLAGKSVELPRAAREHLAVASKTLGEIMAVRNYFTHTPGESLIRRVEILFKDILGAPEPSDEQDYYFLQLSFLGDAVEAMTAARDGLQHLKDSVRKRSSR